VYFLANRSPRRNAIDFRNVRKAFVRGSSSQSREQTTRCLVDGYRETEVVTPIAVDVNVATPKAFVAHSQFSHNPERGNVLGSNTDFDAVDSESRETPIYDESDGGRSDSLPGTVF
jgi:hypothetical protein